MTFRLRLVLFDTRVHTCGFASNRFQLGTQIARCLAQATRDRHRAGIRTSYVMSCSREVEVDCPIRKANDGAFHGAAVQWPSLAGFSSSSCSTAAASRGSIRRQHVTSGVLDPTEVTRNGARFDPGFVLHQARDQCTTAGHDCFSESSFAVTEPKAD